MQEQEDLQKSSVYSPTSHYQTKSGLEVYPPKRMDLSVNHSSKKNVKEGRCERNPLFRGYREALIGRTSLYGVGGVN